MVSHHGCGGKDAVVGDEGDTGSWNQSSESLEEDEGVEDDSLGAVFEGMSEAVEYLALFGE